MTAPFNSKKKHSNSPNLHERPSNIMILPQYHKNFHDSITATSGMDNEKLDDLNHASSISNDNSMHLTTTYDSNKHVPPIINRIQNVEALPLGTPHDTYCSIVTQNHLGHIQ
jgi:hypothetical protein